MRQISRQELFCKKGVPRSFTKFIGKHLCQGLFFIKLQASEKLWHSCFPVNFVKFLRTPLVAVSNASAHYKTSTKVIPQIPLKGHSRAWNNFWQLRSPLKRMKKSFLFPVKISFLSWDINIFFLTFWLCR